MNALADKLDDIHRLIIATGTVSRNATRSLSRRADSAPSLVPAVNDNHVQEMMTKHEHFLLECVDEHIAAKGKTFVTKSAKALPDESAKWFEKVEAKLADAEDPEQVGEFAALTVDERQALFHMVGLKQKELKKAGTSTKAYGKRKRVVAEGEGEGEGVSGSSARRQRRESSDRQRREDSVGLSS